MLTLTAVKINVSIFFPFETYVGETIKIFLPFYKHNSHRLTAVQKYFRVVNVSVTKF